MPIEHTRTPRPPLTNRQLHDLAHDLVMRVGVTVGYTELRDLIIYGDEIGVAPAAIAAARERLRGAAERGNLLADRLLDEIKHGAKS